MENTWFLKPLLLRFSLCRYARGLVEKYRRGFANAGATPEVTGKVLEYVHVLSYRSGRALIALMAGTITLSAAPSELPMFTAGYAGAQSSTYVTSIHWEFVWVGLLVISGAVYNIRLTMRAKSHKSMKTKLIDEAEGRGPASQAGKEKELV